jgi:hypothetical protein
VRPDDDLALAGRDLARALDPGLFAADCGLDALDPWQAEVLAADEARRILLNVHRQGGKSTIAGILGLHSALFEAPSLAVVLAPSLRQSTELVRTVKAMLGRLEGGAPEIALESLTRIELASGSRLVALPGAGAGATIRGLSAVRTLIIDEASRVSRELIAAALPMTATVPAARVIGLSTPAGRHADNWFFQQWHHGEGWLKVRFTGEENPRISGEFLEQQRRELGELLYRQEWLCEFVDDNTAAFSSELIERCFRRDVRPLFAA